MNEGQKIWHLDTVSAHQTNLFETLIHRHNIQSKLKEVEFEGIEPVRGFFAVKESNGVERKYFIQESLIKHLPIRVNSYEDVKLKTGTKAHDIVRAVDKATPFKITPEETMTFRECINGFAPFKHSNPEHWFLIKLLSIASYVSRTYVAVCSESEFGKSSCFDMIHGLTDKCPVFKPRSIPGVLQQINEQGNMVFDEVHGCKKDVRDIIEEFALFIGAGKTYYMNGAKNAKGMKQKYDCMNQSITFVFNNLEQYTNPEKEFFDFIFANNVAMHTRFLKLKLSGQLTEDFEAQFDFQGVAEKNKMYYIKFAKYLAYLSEVIKRNTYTRRYRDNSDMAVKGRRKKSYENLTLLIDMYCDNQAEYDYFLEVLQKAMKEYDKMVMHFKNDGEKLIVTEEVVR